MLKPLGDRVVLSLEEESEESAGGIVLTTNAQERPQIAKVLAVGPGSRTHHGDLIEPAVKVGDRVVFEKFAGSKVKIEGEEYLIAREADLLAVL